MKEAPRTQMHIPETIVDRLRVRRTALSVTELATILGMGRNTLYGHVQAGRIPSYRIRGTIRLDPVVIARWLEQQSMT